jgi:2-C-methyl-D-erythritol 4-phosphate cytidylyltransferase
VSSAKSARRFAVITAAGQSRRMGGTDKLMLPIFGKPLLLHTVSLFANWDELEALVVTVSPGREQEIARLLSGLPRQPRVVTGGKERQDSIRLGLGDIEQHFAPGPEDAVLIHDAARPLVDIALFQALLTELEQCDGVLPALPVRDTVKRVEGSWVTATEDRESLRLVQTPQAFRFQQILGWHRRAEEEGYLGTDDASLVERYGGRVRWIPGPIYNLKVTVPEDIALLSELTRQR